MKVFVVQFPLLGPDPIYSIHSWVEKPFRSSASVCCAFQDLNDIFFNLESGVIAVAQQAYIATNPNLTNAVSAASGVLLIAHDGPALALQCTKAVLGHSLVRRVRAVISRLVGEYV